MIEIGYSFLKKDLNKIKNSKIRLQIKQLKSLNLI